MISKADFPHLAEHNHRITSPATVEYNCIARSAGDIEHWWQPGVYWPIATAIDDYGIAALKQAFLALGFQDCDDGSLESGHEKLALYGTSQFYTHAARQLANGKWTSKLGRLEDIEHETPDDLSGGVYGEVAQFMKRAAAHET